MEIRVSDIPEEGMKVELDPDPADFGTLDTDVALVEVGGASFCIEKVAATTTVRVSGKVDAAVELICSRCGKRFRQPASSRFDLELDPMEAMPGGDEAELRSGDLDVEFYRGGSFELNDLMREQILLQVPMKPLCRDDCKGLCQFCGIDKNEADCKCGPPTGHPGLAGLGGLLGGK